MMVGRLADWFRQWFVTAARYHATLKDRRRWLEELTAVDKERLADSKHWNEQTKEKNEQIKKERDASLESVHTLNDERLRFIEEIAAKDAEIQGLTETNHEQKVGSDLKELANDGLMKVNAALHAQLEMIEGRYTSEMVQHLADQQSKNPLQDIS